MEYTPKSFTLPSLEGISDESVKQHISLYEGYVKNLNAITELVEKYIQNTEPNVHETAELTRRRSFEFDGMRLHELYFEQLEGGASPLKEDSLLSKSLSAQFGNSGIAIGRIQQAGMMRGPGWAVLYYDPIGKQFQIGFAGEQHQGHFATLPILLALDVWEHAFLLDYGALGKAKYIDAFFKNLNWKVIEDRFAGFMK
jgi:Fe-Mn family superoxide dismutase